jgi:hypothetical protein
MPRGFSKKKAKCRKATDASRETRSKKTKIAGVLEHFRLFPLSRYAVPLV